MLPMILNRDARPFCLVGKGEAALRRLKLLKEAGTAPAVYAPDADDALAAEVGEGFTQRLPEPAEMRACVLFIAGLDAETTRELAEEARGVGALVNAEDTPELCDFHVPSVLRRGDMLLTASTGGRVPALARALRRDLSARYGAEWGARLDSLARARADWRAEGLDLASVAKRAETLIADKGWLAS